MLISGFSTLHLVVTLQHIIGRATTGLHYLVAIASLNGISVRGQSQRSKGRDYFTTIECGAVRATACSC
jgi:hypothetical protein